MISSIYHFFFQNPFYHLFGIIHYCQSYVTYRAMSLWQLLFLSSYTMVHIDYPFSFFSSHSHCSLPLVTIFLLSGTTRPTLLASIYKCEHAGFAFPWLTYFISDNTLHVAINDRISFFLWLNNLLCIPSAFYLSVQAWVDTQVDCIAWLW